jgi:hypothetical protein
MHADSVYHTCQEISVNLDSVDWGHDNHPQRIKAPITAPTQLSGALHRPWHERTHGRSLDRAERGQQRGK